MFDAMKLQLLKWEALAAAVTGVAKLIGKKVFDNLASKAVKLPGFLGTGISGLLKLLGTPFTALGKLFIPVLVVIAITILLFIITAIVKRKKAKKQMKAVATETYQQQNTASKVSKWKIFSRGK